MFRKNTRRYGDNDLPSEEIRLCHAIADLRGWAEMHRIKDRSETGVAWLERVRAVLAHTSTEAITAGVKECREERPDLWLASDNNSTTKRSQ